MDIRIDNELFQKVKSNKIEQFKLKHQTIKFKYKKYPFFLNICLNHFHVFSP